jgi:hypothetical protein
MPVITFGLSKPIPPSTKNFGTKKKHYDKYESDKNIYRHKIRTAIFFQHDHASKSFLLQEIIDITQTFKDRNVLYDVLQDLDEELFFYEVCCFYKKNKLLKKSIELSEK